jgi:general secretion pathway protein I
MMCRPSALRRPARRGLSLIEVLVATIVLVLSMVAIGKLVDIGTDRGTDARNTTRGTRLAQSVMAQVEAGLLPLSGDSGGQFEGDDAAWSYQVTSQTVTSPTSPPNLYIVTVTVSRTVQGRQTQVFLTQMMFDPAMMGTAAQSEYTLPDSGTAGGGTGSTTTGSGTTSGTTGSGTTGKTGGTAP